MRVARANPQSPGGAAYGTAFSLLIVILTLATAAPAAGAWPDWLERWLFNPQERTEQARAAVARGVAAEAREPVETTLRILGDHPVAQYNVGTVRVLTGHGEAQPLLRTAAEHGTGDLVADARYNLGNARMAGGDLMGAIEAFQDALRVAPGFEDAKFNLELARRLLAEQQPPEEESEEESEESEQQQPPPIPPPPEEPDFRELPDMSAEEAAAILEAVENMERAERRREVEQTPLRTGGDKDW